MSKIVKMSELRARAADLNRITGRHLRPKSEQLSIEHWPYASLPYRLNIGQHSAMFKANSKSELMAQLDAYFEGVAYGRALEQGVRLQAFADDLIATNGGKVMT